MLCVALWMGLGWFLHLNVNQYLILGIPITVAFQLVIRRQPLRALWVRDAPPFRLSFAGIVLAVMFAAPLLLPLALELRNHAWNLNAVGWDRFLWYLSGVIGAFAAAYSVCQFRRSDLGSLVLCVVVTELIGAVLLLLLLLANPPKPGVTHLQRLGVAALSFLQYVPICFVLEEVFFRGALDAHVYHPGERGVWRTALFVSALWGLWHLPVLPHHTLEAMGALAAIPLVVVHCLVGVPLCLFWRKSGSLLVPAVSHALFDAMRNAAFYTN
jgi:hypothetical protein